MTTEEATIIPTVMTTDFIWRDKIAKAGVDKEVNQYFAAMTRKTWIF